MKNKIIYIKTLQYLLAAILLLFGLNGFFNFLPMPESPQPASEFFGSLIQSGFMMPLIFGVEIIVGFFLLINRYVPLGLLLFAPIALGILLYHLFLDPAGGIAGYFTFLIEVILLFSYKEVYKPILQKN
jgi:hypothetical protein